MSVLICSILTKWAKTHWLSLVCVCVLAIDSFAVGRRPALDSRQPAAKPVSDNGLALSLCAAHARPMCLMEISTTSRVWPANPCVSQSPTWSRMWWMGSPTGLMKVGCFPAPPEMFPTPDNNQEQQVYSLSFTITSYMVLYNRGSALDICCPLVVYGRGPAGVPHHQQLCHTCDGNTSLLRWSLPFQCSLPLPQGKNGLQTHKLIKFFLVFVLCHSNQEMLRYFTW